MKSILVLGATGAMGRRVIAHIDGWHIRAFTRNAKSPIAQDLAAGTPNLTLVEGNTSDRDSLKWAMDGVDAVFVNTDFWTTTETPGEERNQQLAVLALAEELGIAQVIVSSLENCVALSGGEIPVTHFDSKAIVEEEINFRRSLEHFSQTSGFYSTKVTVLRTLPYFENLMSFFTPQVEDIDGVPTHVFSLPIGTAPFSMVALDDIGWFTNHILHNPDEFGGKTLAIGSEAVTGTQIADTFARVTGLNAIYRPVSDEVFLSAGGFAHDALNHFRFHREVGMARDYAALREIHPGLRSFESWLRETGWAGESRLVQKKLAE